MLTVVISDTDWDISAPFGYGIHAIQGPKKKKKSIIHKDKILEI